jgi:polar amino acid transport system substrate-binding protein
MAALVVVVGAAASASLAMAASVDDLKGKSVKIAIGNEPPYTELKPDGTLTGAGPDIDRAVLEQSGITKFEGVVMEYGAMIPAVQARRVDIVSSGGLNMRPDRCEQVIFSNPIICGSTAFMVTKAKIEKAKSWKDVVDNGLTVGVPPGTIHEKVAFAKGLPRERIIPFPDGQSGVKMLQDGRIDVLVLPDASILDLQKKAGDDNLELTLPVPDDEIACAGAAFHKEDTALRDAYNAGLAKIIADGTFSRIMTQYGFNPDPKLVSAKTTEQLCSGSP